MAAAEARFQALQASFMAEFGVTEADITDISALNQAQSMASQYLPAPAPEAVPVFGSSSVRPGSPVAGAAASATVRKPLGASSQLASAQASSASAAKGAAASKGAPGKPAAKPFNPASLAAQAAGKAASAASKKS